MTFRTLEPGDDVHHHEPISVKKLWKGDVTLATNKLVLGRILDSVINTIALHHHHVAHHWALLQFPLWSKSRVINKWHTVLGELRSVTLGLPGAAGLFSTLQEALRHPQQCHIHITPAVHNFLDEFRALTSTLSDHPTHIAELLPHAHFIIGASDASGAGWCGFHFLPLPNGTIQPLLWRQPLPSIITDCLIANNNPSGTITMNDFELAASMAHQDVIA
jgi:hypothetical protein